MYKLCMFLNDSCYVLGWNVIHTIKSLAIKFHSIFLNSFRTKREWCMYVWKYLMQGSCAKQHDPGIISMILIISKILKESTILIISSAKTVQPRLHCPTPNALNCQIERLKTPHHVIIQKMAKLYYTSCLDGVWIKIKKVWINPNKSMH